MNRKKYIVRKTNEIRISDNISNTENIEKNSLRNQQKKSDTSEFTINISEMMKSKLWINIASLSVLFIIGIIIYSNIFDNQPQFDDILWTDYPEFKNLNEPMDIVNIGRLRALTLLSFAVNYHFSEMNLTSYFAFNLSVHLINTILVWLIFQLILRTPVIRDYPIAKYAKLAAFLAALVYVTHPIMTQAVTYIYQRLASFTTMFYLLTVFNFLKGLLSEKRVNKILFYSLCFFSFALGAISKEIIFTAPIMLLIIYTIFFHQKIKIKAIYVIIAFLAGGVAVYIGTQMLGLQQLFGVKTSYLGEEISNYNYFITQFLVIAKYLQLFIYPYNLNFDYDWRVINSFWSIAVILPLILHLCIFAATYYIFKKNRLAAFGIIWIYVTLAVESTIIPIEDIIFEHRMYLPMFGFSIFLISSALSFIKEKHLKAIIITIAAWALINSAFTFYRNMIWDNPISLWSDVIKKSPEKTRAHIFLAHAYINNNELEKAISVYTEAIRKAPDKKSAYMGRAVAYFSMGQYDKAIEDYTQAIKNDADDPFLFEDRAKTYIALKQYHLAVEDLKHIENSKNHRNKAMVYYYLGEANMHLGNFEEAMKYTRLSLQINQNHSNSIKQLINIALKMEDFQSAIEYSTILINQEPDNFQAYIIRGDAYKFSNQFEMALSDFYKAFELNRNDTKSLKNIAIIYFDTKNYLKSAEIFETIIKITPNDYEAFFDMGTSYYMGGKVQRALQCFQRVLQINPNYDPARQSIDFINKNVNF